MAAPPAMSDEPNRATLCRRVREPSRSTGTMPHGVHRRASGETKQAVIGSPSEATVHPTATHGSDETLVMNTPEPKTPASATAPAPTAAGPRPPAGVGDEQAVVVT